MKKIAYLDGFSLANIVELLIKLFLKYRKPPRSVFLLPKTKMNQAIRLSQTLSNLTHAEVNIDKIMETLSDIEAWVDFNSPPPVFNTNTAYIEIRR